MAKVQSVEAAAKMDVLDFIASMTGSLAWPLAAVVIALLFRGQIVALFNRISELGLWGANAKFAKQLDKAEQTAEALPAPPFFDFPASDVVGSTGPAIVPPPRHTKDRPAQPNPPPEDTDYAGQSGRFRDLLEISPSAAILDTFRVIERIIERLSENKQLNLPLRRTSTAMIARHLHRAGLIDKEVELLVAELQQMRNSAAHGVDTTVTDAIRFREIGNRVAGALVEAGSRPS